MNSWHEKEEVKKGDYGEFLVREHLESLGYIIYEPKTEGPHAFDKLCIMNKREIIIAEVKTKARMNKWNATGFNTKNYDEYIYILDKFGIDIFIYFVDEWLRKIYGNKLSILRMPYIADDGEYPMLLNKVVLFSLECMPTIKTLNNDDVDFLQKHSTRKYDYEANNGK